jgi:hypothetical protein
MAVGATRGRGRVRVQFTAARRHTLADRRRASCGGAVFVARRRTLIAQRRASAAAATTRRVRVGMLARRPCGCKHQGCDIKPPDRWTGRPIPGPHASADPPHLIARATQTLSPRDRAICPTTACFGRHVAQGICRTREHCMVWHPRAAIAAIPWLIYTSATQIQMAACSTFHSGKHGAVLHSPCSNKACECLAGIHCA